MLLRRTKPTRARYGRISHAQATRVAVALGRPSALALSAQPFQPIPLHPLTHYTSVFIRLTRNTAPRPPTVRLTARTFTARTGPANDGVLPPDADAEILPVRSQFKSIVLKQKDYLGGLSFIEGLKARMRATQPELATHYNYLLFRLGRDRKWTFLSTVLKHMRNQGVEWDSRTYAERIKILPQRQETWKEFDKLWEELKKKKLEMPSYLQASIGAYLQRSNYEKAMTQVLRDIEVVFGARVHHHYLNALLGLYSRQRHEKKVLHLLQFIRDRGELTDTDLAIALKIYTEKRLEKRASQIFERMVKENLPVGLHTLTEMLQMFNSMNDSKAALEFYKTYVEPNYSVFESDNAVAQLLRIYNGLGDYENANSTFQHFLEHYPRLVGEASFNIMIRSKIYSADVTGMQKILAAAARLKEAKPVWSMVTYRTIFQVIASKALDTLHQSYERDLWKKAALSYRDQAKSRQMNVFTTAAYLVDVFDYLNEPELVQYYCLNLLNQAAEEPHPTLQVRLLKHILNKRIRQMAVTANQTPYSLPDYIDGVPRYTPKYTATTPEYSTQLAQQLWAEDAAFSDSIANLFTTKSEYANKSLHATPGTGGPSPPGPESRPAFKTRQSIYNFMNPDATFDQLWEYTMYFVEGDRVKKSDFVGPTLVAFCILNRRLDKLQVLIDQWNNGSLVFNLEEYYLQLKFLNTLGDPMLVIAFTSTMNFVANQANIDVPFQQAMYINSVFTAGVTLFKHRLSSQLLSATKDNTPLKVPPGLTFVPNNLPPVIVSEPKIIAFRPLDKALYFTIRIPQLNADFRPLLADFKSFLTPYSKAGDYITCQYIIQVATQQYGYHHDAGLWSHVIQALIVAQEVDLADRLASALASQKCMQSTDILSSIVTAWRYKANRQRAQQITALFGNYGVQPRQSLLSYIHNSSIE